MPKSPSKQLLDNARSDGSRARYAQVRGRPRRSHVPLDERTLVHKLLVLALIGILIRNSVILVVQIDHLIGEGRDPWHAVIEASEHRMRPIALTAAAASLALIPIAREVFWGPMAYAMMGGIVVGTVLTLIFLPALYVAWFRITPPPSDGQIDSDADLVQVEK
jgi:hypothetical protein